MRSVRIVRGLTGATRQLKKSLFLRGSMMVCMSFVTYNLDRVLPFMRAHDHSRLIGSPNLHHQR